jgi:hypothetical protein
MQGSSALRVSAGVPNPQSRTLEEQPLETPSTDVQAIEQISTKLKSHLKEELIDHLSEMLQKLFGIKPKQQIYMYKTPYPSGYDQIPFPQRFKVPDFNKFSWQDDTSIMEHTTRFIIQCREAWNIDALRIRLFSSSVSGPAFSWFTSLLAIPLSSDLIWSSSSTIISSLAFMR